MKSATAVRRNSSRVKVHGRRPTIGVLNGAQIHTGRSAYVDALVVGLMAAARRSDCNLLLGVAAGSSVWNSEPAWPIAGSDRTFAPVGPWNTDGLVVVNPLRSEKTVEDARRFQRDGHPLVYLSDGPDDPRVVPDNRGGIESALQHLAEHGHRRIVFLSCETGDGPDRLAAFEAVVRTLGLDADPALIVDGDHEWAASSDAIGRLVESGIEFTAVLASNEGSGRGALMRLQALGISVPDDVAVVAFDDFLEALVTSPAMSCVHFPIDRYAATAIDTLIGMIEDGAEPPPLQTVPTKLVLRESCGCTPVYDAATSERERRTLVKQMFEQTEVSHAVSGFAAQLLRTPQLDMIELGRILLDTLPRVGMTDCILGVYEADGDDPVGWSAVQIGPDQPLVRFRTRTFPPPELVRDDESFQLIVLPLRLYDEFGFIAFPSDDVYSCTAIVSQSEAAFESARNVMVRKEAEAALTRSEDRLRQAQKMEAVGQLAGGIAHDLNNLLTPIIGCSELLLSSLTDPEERANVELIGTAAERSASLTRQLLAFSRRQIIQPVVLDLNAVLRETRTLLEQLLGGHVELDLRLGSPIHVKVDRSQLEQVIINLAVNAREAMPAGGSLAIETGSVSIDSAADTAALPPGDYATLVVCDTGTGMTDEIRQHVFEPFFTTKKVGEGTGLGLATAYGILKQSGGDIEVESSRGAGSTFTVYLPTVAAPEAEGDVGARSKSPQNDVLARDETVLLVEDEAAVRMFVRRVLETSDYNVIEAGDGVEALELCRRHGNEIDALVTDVTMPKMNGMELIEAVAREYPEIAVICMSGYVQESIFNEYIISPNVAFLAKPFSGPALIEMLRCVLATRAGMAATASAA